MVNTCMRVLLIFVRVIRFNSLRHDSARSVTFREILTLGRDSAGHIARLHHHRAGQQSDKSRKDNNKLFHIIVSNRLQRYCFLSEYANRLHFFRFFHFFLVSRHLSQT